MCVSVCERESIPRELEYGLPHTGGSTHPKQVESRGNLEASLCTWGRELSPELWPRLTGAHSGLCDEHSVWGQLSDFPSLFLPLIPDRATRGGIELNEGQGTEPETRVPLCLNLPPKYFTVNLSRIAMSLA